MEVKEYLDKLVAEMAPTLIAQKEAKEIATAKIKTELAAVNFGQLEQLRQIRDGIDARFREARKSNTIDQISDEEEDLRGEVGSHIFRLEEPIRNAANRIAEDATNSAGYSRHSFDSSEPYKKIIEFVGYVAFINLCDGHRYDDVAANAYHIAVDHGREVKNEVENTEQYDDDENAGY